MLRILLLSFRPGEKTQQVRERGRGVETDFPVFDRAVSRPVESVRVGDTDTIEEGMRGKRRNRGGRKTDPLWFAHDVALSNTALRQTIRSRSTVTFF